MEALQNPDMSNMGRAAQSPHIDADVFPPLRSRVPDPSFFLPYIPEDIAFEEEYEEYLSDLGLSDPSYVPDPATGGSPRTSGLSAWQRLADFAGDVADGISDSESIVSIGELADESRGDNAQGDSDSDSSSVDENLNNWEASPYLTYVANSILTSQRFVAAYESQDIASASKISSRRNSSAVQLWRFRSSTSFAVWIGRWQRCR
jgi:hypothetical protein